MRMSQSAVYEICIEEHLTASWSKWFEGFRISPGFNESGKPITLLMGQIPDQSALYGLLAKLQNLGLTLIFLKRQD